MKILKPVLFIQLLCYKGKILNIYFYFFSSNEWHTLFINVDFCVYEAKSIRFDNCSSAYRQIFRSYKYDISIFLIIKGAVHVVYNDLLMKQIHNARSLIWATMRKMSLFFHKLKFSNIALYLQTFDISN